MRGGGTIFCNPPYGRQLKLWVKKAYEESIKNRNTIVLLIPARTDTSYFHDYIYRKAEVRFIKGRLTFTDEDGNPQVDAKGRPMPAPFPSMLVIYNGGKKMERLTIRNTDGSVSQPTDSTFEKVFKRLAEYEDTEMTPKEIEEMKIDLCNAEALLTGEYGVEITEISKMKVYVTARNREEDERIVRRRYEKGEYVLDETHLKSASIDAV